MSDGNRDVLGLYYGEERLLFCFDIGTTMTAATVTYLADGQKPTVLAVNEYAGQATHESDSKVPTQIRYDRQNPPRPLFFGEEAIDSRNKKDTDLVKWFKLHLHPESMRAASETQLPPLPPNLTIGAIYTDMLDYVFRAATHFTETKVIDRQGLPPWPRLKNTLEVCLAIPNGWGTREQDELRHAAFNAGIFGFVEAGTRLRFVSEAEASVHFAIQCGQSSAWLREGSVFAVCDVGGSTADTTVYRCTRKTPELAFEEVTASECVAAGGVFVDAAAKQLLEERFHGTPYAAPNFIAHAVQEFERKAKRRYAGGSDEQYIEMDRSCMHEDDPDRGMEEGMATLSSADLRRIFNTSVLKIGQSVCAAISRAGLECQTLIVVGGFGESPFLRKELQSLLHPDGINMFKLGQPAQKAAALGGAYWHCQQLVVARAARETYGISCLAPVQRFPAIHWERQHLAQMTPHGQRRIPGRFDPMIQRNQIIQADEARRASYFQTFTTRPDKLEDFKDTIIATDGGHCDYWCRTEDGENYMPGFRAVCTIRANLSGLERRLRQIKSPTGEKYWRVDYDVEIFFGRTALGACVVWKEDGVERRSPVEFIPESVS